MHTLYKSHELTASVLLEGRLTVRLMISVTWAFIQSFIYLLTQTVTGFTNLKQKNLLCSEAFGKLLGRMQR